MKKARILLSFALVMALVMSSVVALAADEKPAPAKPEAVTIKGVVEAAQKDAAGNVIAAQIVVGAEKYRVVPNEKGKELLSLVGKTVEATGQVTVKADGAKKIAVESYKVAEM